MFVLLVCPLLVSGQCSTCLEGRCYDNGECIIGCLPGYIGRYCEADCPPSCVNNECYIDRIKGTVTCIDGCEPGYCGAKCSLRCPQGCETCSRQCGSCNVTLCPERRYGADCSSECSPRYEKCDRETGECLRCRRGYYGDDCTRECRACFTRADNIVDRCLSGCERCKVQETCTPGFYGERCEHRCSEGCLQSDDDFRRACNRATGECSAGCVSGYHGLACNNTCNKLCLDGICYQHNGVCISGCIHGYEQKFDVCEKLLDTEVNEGFSGTVFLVLNILLSTIVIIGILICVGYLCYRTRKRSGKKPTDMNMMEPMM